MKSTWIIRSELFIKMIPKEFSKLFFCGCFGLGTARVKALGELKKERKKPKMTKLDFHRFQVRYFSNNFEQSPCYCKIGQRQRADLSVFGSIKFITR